MAYGLKYIIPFTNRGGILCEVRISQLDYAGDPTTLEGSEQPFTLSYRAQDNKIPYGIKASEAEIQFVAGNLSLLDFYTENDIEWLVEFTQEEIITWTGYLQLDDCKESLTDIDHIISLNANDGLSRLGELYLLSDQNDAKSLLHVQWKITELLAFIFNLVGTNLDTAAYLNIFENTLNDRSDSNTADFLQQTVVNTDYYNNTDGTTLSLYDILNSILTDFRCVLFQADGRWNIIRWGEMRLFDDGEMPGTLYNYDFSSVSAINFPERVTIGRGHDIHPVNENQETSIVRPIKFAKETFNYSQPPFIIQADLQLPTGATPFDTDTDGDLQYDKYSLATYFPFWTQRDGDDSYLVVVTNTTTNSEVERYIYQPQVRTDYRYVQFNPIPVTKGDVLDFSLNFRTPGLVPDNFFFYMRFILVMPDGNYYSLSNLSTPGLVNLFWAGPAAVPGSGDFGSILGRLVDVSAEEEQEYIPWQLSDQMVANQLPVPFPEDGVLLIWVGGTNDINMVQGETDVIWKDIQIRITQYINSSTIITGQYHNNSQEPDIRKNLQLTPRHDDSPRNTILGTLFKSDLTTFAGGIGDLYFDKTALWHRANISEEKRLGELNTMADLFNARRARSVVDGDFYATGGISILNAVAFDFFEDKVFAFGVGEFDFMECIFKGTFYELYDQGESDGDLDNEFEFNYLYDNVKK